MRSGFGVLHASSSLHSSWAASWLRALFHPSPSTLLILAYGLASFPVALLNNIWVTYSYPFFVGGVLRESSLFIVVQLLYLVWNCTNDPLFGWMSDKTSVQGTDGSSDGAQAHPCRRRLKHMRAAGYLLGAAFLFAWFPWSTSSTPLAALHFFLSLALYDGALTWMEVNHASLLADITTNSKIRAWCNAAASVFSIIGSFSSFFAHCLYSSDDLASNPSTSSTDSSGGSSSVHAALQGNPSGSFRWLCFGLAMMCIPAVEVSTRYIDRWAMKQRITTTNKSMDGEKDKDSMEMQALVTPTSEKSQSSGQTKLSIETAETEVDSGQQIETNIMTVRVAPNANAAPSSASTPQSTLPPSKSASSSSSSNSSVSLTFRQFVRQLFSHRNFGLFCSVRLLQTFLCTFEKNHLSSFLDLLFTEVVGAPVRGMIISLSFVLPHLLLLLTSTISAKMDGVYGLIRGLFTTKVMAALAMISMLASGTGGGIQGFGSSSALAYAVLVYLCGSRVLTECVCRLFPLVVSNLVDEDRVLHHRPSSMAATLIGTSSLLAKPGESLAPMLGWKVLNMLAVADIGSTSAVQAQVGADGTTTTLTQSTVASTASKQGLLYLLLSLPLLTVSIQLLLWSCFTLRGQYLRNISHRVKQFDHGHDSSDSTSVNIDDDGETRSMEHGDDSTVNKVSLA